MTVSETSSLNAFQRGARHVIASAFKLSVFLIQKVCRMTPYREKVKAWERLPSGTLGHDIARCLRDHRLDLVPGYESHDLKHVLLGFEMTPEGETRLQAFMLGNGNRTIPCVAILAFGAVLMPELWAALLAEYRRGKKTESIVDWEIEVYAERSAVSLRREIGLAASGSPQGLLSKELTLRAAAGFSMAAGAFGMLYCAPHLWSPYLADLVGAGFPFVGAAILFGAGLVTLGLLNREPHSVPQGS